ncbi:MAG: hypothetical protein JW909_03920 [Planctomycetes bacterium]|nr:hypothetical protein [Planctomycetota bacterium]
MKKALSVALLIGVLLLVVAAVAGVIYHVFSPALPASAVSSLPVAGDGSPDPSGAPRAVMPPDTTVGDLSSTLPPPVEDRPSAPVPPVPAPAGQDQPAGKVVDYGGGVSVLPAERTIILKGRTCVAMNEGLEWGIVLSRGKEYESVVAVDADASMIQFTLIALGYNQGGGVDVQGDQRVPTGDRLIVEVEWELEGTRTTRRLEELVWNIAQKRRMLSTSFVFTGSKMITDSETNSVVFAATAERLVLALYRDPAAILNNPLETGSDDIYYIANRRTLPPKGTPVTVYIRPVPAAEPAPAASPENASAALPAAAPAQGPPLAAPPASPLPAAPPPAGAGE